MAARTMRAVQYSGAGGGAAALRYVEIPVPWPKKGEILVKVEAASLNPADWVLQNGTLRPFIPQYPFTPVSDIAGDVVGVGPQVDGFAIGDKVVSKLDFWKAGGLAEYAVAPASFTVHRPEGVSAADAAGVPIAGLTALQALRCTGISSFDGTAKGGNMLITGASGGIGTYAVQLAKLMNFHVTATCGARNVELVRSLGADEVLDYKTPEGQSLKSPSGKKYDFIVSTVVDGAKWSVGKELLTDVGKFIDIAPGMENFMASIGTAFCKKKLVTIMLTLGGKDLELLIGLMKEGKLRTVVDSRHPFDRAGDAWEKSMAKHATGKIIVYMQ